MSTQQPGSLLCEVERLLERFVVLPDEHAKVALALFTLHTWAIEGAHATPYVIILSAEKQSGKSRLTEVLKFAVSRPYLTSSASEAALFQIIELERPTLLIDESDAIFGTSTDRSEALRGILNAGNRPGSQAIRGGKDGVPLRYAIFCAKVLAGIDTGKLPETIRDRGITIRMKRRTRSEPIERFRERVVEAETEHLRAELAAWAEAHTDTLRDAEPHLREELPDRAADSWEPLFAIADLADGDWPARARRAAIALSVPTECQSTGVGTELLASIRRALGADVKIASRDLLQRVNRDDAAPFGGWSQGVGMTERELAKRLKPYGVKPKTLRVTDTTVKGYTAAMFSDAFERYLPSQNSLSVTKNPHEYYDVTDVTDVTDIYR